MLTFCVKQQTTFFIEGINISLDVLAVISICGIVVRLSLCLRSMNTVCLDEKFPGHWKIAFEIICILNFAPKEIYMRRKPTTYSMWTHAKIGKDACKTKWLHTSFQSQLLQQLHGEKHLQVHSNERCDFREVSYGKKFGRRVLKSRNFENME